MSEQISTNSPGPLGGFLVVAIEQAVAAPICTQRLADAGARIIKIERPGGDFARKYDTAAAGESSYFVWLNRGKKSVELDMTTPEGLAQVSQLLDRADILVQNLKSGALDRLGLDVEQLRARNPGLICCSITGYGDDEPYASRKAYDLLVQAESGLASVSGSPAEPGRVGMSVVDIATGSTAYAAILEAIIARSISKKGCDIRISMFDVIAEWLTVPLLNAEAGNFPDRMGLAHPSIAPYGVFRTADGSELVIAVQSEREWQSLCNNVLGRPDLCEDPRTSSNVARVRNRSESDALVAEGLGKLTRAEAVEALSRAAIAFGEVNNMHGLSCHPRLRRLPVSSVSGTTNVPIPAPLFDGCPRIASQSVPGLGADNDEVLSPPAAE